MGNFYRDRGDRRGGGNFGRRDNNRSFNRDRGDNRPGMHKAVCDKCGQNCEVPFRPTGDKPIFCSDCFSKQGGRDSRPNKFGGDRDRRPRFENKGGDNSKEILKGIKTLNYKLDELIKTLAGDAPREDIKEVKAEKKKVKKVAKKKTTPKKKAVTKKKKKKVTKK
ncbi:hypothetical protein K8R42_01175 [bacterium]|nr:hypothetical protein [bacterium]